ncbi:acyltransferase [Enterococcus alcedinis]|uniref:Membrane protein n=1 Tax=Enterococcus alcedinis TaxID=1274384 RepID=A0A917JI33_9ENTE|nr:acyltransferase family protein [Enterococcus alcedinis]MBP2102766.1 surface polysaccharide O-acyltransferase-like enzyme [Enterococcus alcedinis]GGI66327.1 membrane protein [Enterococcus alcedinis]
MLKRVVYFDYLRIIATFAVIVLHVAARNIELFEINSLQWNVYVFYDSLVRFSVPIFIMISGALFLGTNYNLKTIFVKRIPRLVTAFIFWSLLYALINPNFIGLKEIVIETIKGHSHMWFLPMIIGLYISIPVLSLVSKNKLVLQYFISVSFVFSFVLPTLTILINDFGTPNLILITNSLNKTIALTNIGAVSGYFCYYVLGYYLSTKEIDTKIKKWIFVLGVFGILSTYLLTVKASVNIARLSVNYFANISVNVFLASVMVFILGKTYLNRFDNKIVRDLSRYTFGAFLVHALIISKIYEYFDFSTLSPVTSVPIISIIVFLISLLISFVLNKIPIVNKFIV